jgi:hypothetical protein
MMADESQALVVQTGPLVMRGEMDISATRARVDDFVERIKLMDEVVTKLMEEGDGADYWKIPTAKKPSLLNAGADKLNAFFGYAPSFEVVDSFLDKLTWVYSVKYRCILTHRDSGVVVGEGIGSCTNRESKYYYRGGERVCPKCGKPFIKKSKYPPRGAAHGTEPGWYCYSKLGGCGEEFAVNDPAIVDQSAVKAVNPDLADTLNTIDKMAQKRSKVAAVLNVTGLTRKYTQDVEDAPRQQAAGNDDPPPDDPYVPEDTHTTDRNPTAPPAKMVKDYQAEFAKGVKALYPNEPPAVVQEKIQAAGAAVVGPEFDGKWRALAADKLAELMAEMHEQKGA